MRPDLQEQIDNLDGRVGNVEEAERHSRQSGEILEERLDGLKGDSETLARLQIIVGDLRDRVKSMETYFGVSEHAKKVSE